MENNIHTNLSNKIAKKNSHKEFIESNRNLWNSWATINYKSQFYNVDAFRAGESSLKHIELNEIGDVNGKSLLHLQCHFGLDTLSWAKNGANVTGVDFSDEAICIAQKLSHDLKIPAQFICTDIYDLPKVLNEKFDIVFTSYGVLAWLFNLNKWAEIIAYFLKPGGMFYIVEFHPFINMLNTYWTKIDYSYFNETGPSYFEQTGLYSETKSDFSHAVYEWPHTFSEVLCALRQAGLIVDFFNEYDYSTYNCFPNLEQVGEERYAPKDQKNSIPLMYSIKATFMPNLLVKK